MQTITKAECNCVEAPNFLLVPVLLLRLLKLERKPLLLCRPASRTLPTGKYRAISGGAMEELSDVPSIREAVSLSGRERARISLRSVVVAATKGDYSHRISVGEIG
jgi:hypothetical protein